MSEHIDSVVAAVDRVLASAAPGVDDDGRPASAEQQAQNWQDTARQYSRNADYWRKRFERADRERADWKRWCEANERCLDQFTDEVDRLRAAPCPHVIRGDEGTAHCGLDADRLHQLTGEVDRLRQENEALHDLIERGDFDA